MARTASMDIINKALTGPVAGESEDVDSTVPAVAPGLDPMPTPLTDDPHAVEASTGEGAEGETRELSAAEAAAVQRKAERLQAAADKAKERAEKAEAKEKELAEKEAIRAQLAADKAKKEARELAEQETKQASERQRQIDEALAKRQQEQEDAFKSSANATVNALTKIGRNAALRLERLPAPGSVMLPLLVLGILLFVMIPVNGHSRLVWLWMVITDNASTGGAAQSPLYAAPAILNPGQSTVGAPPPIINPGQQGHQATGGGEPNPAQITSIAVLPGLRFTGAQDIS